MHVAAEEEAREVDGVGFGGDEVVEDGVDGGGDVGGDTCINNEGDLV